MRIRLLEHCIRETHLSPPRPAVAGFSRLRRQRLWFHTPGLRASCPTPTRVPLLSLHVTPPEGTPMAETSVPLTRHDGTIVAHSGDVIRDLDIYVNSGAG